MNIIGSAWVQIQALTQGLRREIRDEVNSIHESVDVGVNADTTQAIRDLHAIANESVQSTVDVEANIVAAEAEVERLRQMIAQQNASVHVDANTRIARAEVDDMADHVRRTQANVHVDANTTTANTRINLLTRLRRAFVWVSLDDAIARARMDLLTRTRNIRVMVQANATPLKVIGDYLARFSGARVSYGIIKDLVEEFSNLDKQVPKIAMAATKFGTMGGAIASAAASALTLGSSLVNVAGAVGALAPAFGVGFMVGIGSLMISLKDFQKQLPGVVTAYKSLGTILKENFWGVAREPLRDMAMTLLPAFKTHLDDTGRALGTWAGKVGQTLKFALNEGNTLPNMFGNLNKSIAVATPGAQAIVAALVDLGHVGSAYLPKLAQWFTDIATRFANFIDVAAQDGTLKKYIDDGIAGLKLLGNILGSIGGLFGHLTDAAKAANANGLQALANTLSKLDAMAGSAQGMTALTTIFSGARWVTTQLGDEIVRVMQAIGSAAPAIYQAFLSITGIVHLFGDALSGIISDPTFQAGFAQMFDGIHKGFAALLPVFADSGPKFGELLKIIGDLAANIGGILGAAFRVALPAITEFKKAIEPLIPVLGDSLIKIIYALQPSIDQFAAAFVAASPAIADIIKNVAEFTAQLIKDLGPYLPVVIAAIMGLVGAVKALSAIVGIVKFAKDVVGAFKLIGTAWRLLSAAFMANPVMLAIAAIVALVAAVISAYNNIGWFHDFVDSVFKAIGDIINNVVSYWNTDFIPMWNNAMGAIGSFFDGVGKWFAGIGQWIGDAVNNVVNFFNSFGQGSSDAMNAVGSFFGDIGKAIGDFVNGVGQWFGGIGQAIGDAFNGAVSFVQDVFTNIGNAIITFMAPIITGWQAGWQAISDWFIKIWNGIVWFWQPVINLITALITGVINVAVAIWQAGWEIISTIFYGIWINLVRFFTPIIQSISDTITAVVLWISGTWNATWQAISDFFVGIWNNIVAWATPIIQSISDTITAVVIYVSGVWNSTWQSISDFFIGIWNGIVSWATPIIQSISTTINNTVSFIAAIWNSYWNQVVATIQWVWNLIVTYVSGQINQVSSVINSVISWISGVWNSTWSNISSFVSGVWNNIVNSVSGFVRDVQNNVSNFLNDVGRIGSDILGKIGDFGTLLVNAGRDLINGLAQGVTNGSDWLVQKIREVASNATDAIKNFFGIKSPSRLMRDEVGKQIGAGLAIGIQQSADVVKKATLELAANAVPVIPDVKLPTISGTSAGTTVSAPASSSVALPMSTVFGATGQNGAAPGGLASRFGNTTNVTFQVNPSPGLDEEQIGVSALEHMYWKLANTPAT